VRGLHAVTAATLLLGFAPAPLSSQAIPDANQARPSFSEWLLGVRAEALTRGIREDVLDEALSGLDEPLPIVLERDRAQAETVLTLEQYVARRVTPAFVATGREMLSRHRTLLEVVAARYGVPPTILVAIWGIESNYGRFTGVRPTVAALATLAWDPRRSTFFRNELFNALEILNRGDIELTYMRGSWAGAMGQVQFMPSSYLRWAEDHDGDGRRDIWTSTGDVFASIANYLKAHGWTPDEPWGHEVRLSVEVARRVAADVPRRDGTCRATRDMTSALPLDRWQELGVNLLRIRALPASLSLVSGSSRRFLVGHNYDALLDYNCAHAYGISVGLLADAIGTPPKAPAKASTAKGTAKGRTPSKG
jgi:membrane-bound lytic murein transglycosylase B